MRVQEEIYAATNTETTKYAAAFTGMANLMKEIATDEVFKLFETFDQIRHRLKGYKKLNLFNLLRSKGYWYWVLGRYEEVLKDREDEFGKDDKKGMRL